MPVPGHDRNASCRAMDIPVLVTSSGITGALRRNSCSRVVACCFRPGMRFSKRWVTHHLQFAGRSLRVRETWLVARSHRAG